MSAINTSQVPFPGSTSLFLRRFSVDEYHRMIDTGVFAKDDRFELLDGWVIAKMPHNPPHDLSVSLGQKQLQTRLPAGWICRVQSAVTLPASEPEPDLAVVLGPERRYTACHPGPKEIDRLIEVSDSTLADDRSEKGAVYAQANIKEYWIINLVHQQVEVYTDPSGPVHDPAFRQRTVYGLHEAVPLIIDGQNLGAIPVTDLLP
jgi:Uma2 family endonuclease